MNCSWNSFRIYSETNFQLKPHKIPVSTFLAFFIVTGNDRCVPSISSSDRFKLNCLNTAARKWFLHNSGI